jgi:Tetratrico peptide repeat
MTDEAKARDLFARAGELDAAGREAEAAPLYEQAFAAGLTGDDLQYYQRALREYAAALAG